MLSLLLAAADSWLPVEEGRQWVYRGSLTLGEEEREVEFTIESAVSPDGSGMHLRGSFMGMWGWNALAEAWDAPPAMPAQVYDGIRVTERGIEIVEPRVPWDGPYEGEGWLWIPAIAEEGARWDGRYEFDSREYSFEYRWGPTETAAVQAGVHEARRLEFTIRNDNPRSSETTGTYWLTPGIGPVRLEWDTGEPEGAAIRVELVRTVAPAEDG